jgi:hypothetical protein
MLTRWPSNCGSCSSILRLWRGELLGGDGLGRVQRGEEGFARVVGETRPFSQ